MNKKFIKRAILEITFRESNLFEGIDEVTTKLMKENGTKMKLSYFFHVIDQSQQR